MVWRLWDEPPDTLAVSSNPSTKQWIDIFQPPLLLKRQNCLTKKQKINEKETGECPFFHKKIIKLISYLLRACN